MSNINKGKFVISKFDKFKKNLYNYFKLLFIRKWND